MGAPAAGGAGGGHLVRTGRSRIRCTVKGSDESHQSVVRRSGGSRATRSPVPQASTPLLCISLSLCATAESPARAYISVPEQGGKSEPMSLRVRAQRSNRRMTNRVILRVCGEGPENEMFDESRRLEALFTLNSPAVFIPVLKRDQYLWVLFS